MRTLVIATLLSGALGAPALAQTLAFRATLSGDHAPTATGSAATGTARLSIHPRPGTVDLVMDVHGIGLDDLSTDLRASPIGPIHLHLYGGHDHTDPNADVKLVFSAPFDGGYRATPNGFRLRITRASYAGAAAALRSPLTLDAFVHALRAGQVVLNVHTNAWPEGEISGDVRAAQPGGV